MRFFSGIINSYNSSVQNCQNYARSVLHVNGHKRLDHDATENAKPHLRLKREAAFAALGEYVAIEGLKGL